MFDFPEKYQSTKMGMAVRDGQLQQVAEFSGILNAPMQFLHDAIKQFCEDKIANVEELQSKDAINAYRMLKNTYSNVWCLSKLSIFCSSTPKICIDRFTVSNTMLILLRISLFCC